MTIPTASAGKRGVGLCFSAWKSNPTLDKVSTKSSNSSSNVSTLLKLPSSPNSSNTTSSSLQSPENQNFFSTVTSTIPAVLDIVVGLLGMAGLFLLGGRLTKFKQSS